MRVQFLVLTAVALTSLTAHASPPAELCKVLRVFVKSVEPDKNREFVFRTSWGVNFKDMQESAISAKRCVHNNYEPAKAVCAYLMEHGSTEFTGVNVKDAISCLSRKTKFDSSLRLTVGEFFFNYGTDNQGALIRISFREDQKIGGMAFRLVVDGY